MIGAVRTVAVLVVDMAGFSKMADPENPKAALPAVKRFRKAAKPIIRSHGGRLVKAVADNLFCTFPSVFQAYGAAHGILDHTLASAGIGYGPTYLPFRDLWGDEVNKASKLGEDIAKHGAILFTKAAQAELVRGRR